MEQGYPLGVHDSAGQGWHGVLVSGIDAGDQHGGFRATGRHQQPARSTQVSQTRGFTQASVAQRDVETKIETAAPWTAGSVAIAAIDVKVSPGPLLHRRILVEHHLGAGSGAAATGSRAVNPTMTPPEKASTARSTNGIFCLLAVRIFFCATPRVSSQDVSRSRESVA